MTRMPGYCLRTDVDLFRREAHVHRAVTFPQDQPRVLELLLRESAERLERIPHDHLVERHAHLPRGVAAEMLIGQEQDLLLPRPTPTSASRPRSTTCRWFRRVRRRTT